MKRFLISTIILLITFSCFSQDLNNYKYVVIPYEFDFLKKHDKYRVNTLLRYLFKKEGFEVLYDTESFPKELGDDRCLALYANINNDSSIFTTKMAIVLRDCSNQIVMETTYGRSKIKAYEAAYNQALKRAFEDIKAKNYTYVPKEKDIVETSPIVKTPKKVVENVTVTVAEEKPPIKKTVVQNGTVKKVTTTKELILYAQPIENGYQLVDSTPKVVMILLKTGVPNVYLVKGQDATVYQENGQWMLSKATNGGNEKSAITIKF